MGNKPKWHQNQGASWRLTSDLFRSDESYQSERITRDAVVPFLQDRGITVLEDARRAVGLGQSQVVAAELLGGRQVKMRVRLCWRRDGRNPREALYSAFQLRARTLDGDWGRTLQHIADRDAEESISHTLAIQREGSRIAYAALIPSTELPAIWQRQREVSEELVHLGAMGRNRKNHAANGDSPTLWLQDDRTERAHEVPAVLWTWPGVVDLANLPVIALERAQDDSWDDISVADYLHLGSDGATRQVVQRSSVKRDRKVRAAVIERSGGCCERTGCGVSRDFQGFLDVHHILGAEHGDRVWNCVALCPNCHRGAHFARDSDAINAELFRYAGQFKGPA